MLCQFSASKCLCDLRTQQMKMKHNILWRSIRLYVYFVISLLAKGVIVEKDAGVISYPGIQTKEMMMRMIMTLSNREMGKKDSLALSVLLENSSVQ